MTGTEEGWPQDGLPRSAVIVAAHPDDEVVGAGLLLWRLAEARILHVTDGAPRNGADAQSAGFATCEAYAAARHEEALAALSLAGIAPERLTALGVPDQEATPGLAPLAGRLAALLGESGAPVVVTHAYEGGHPDHDATAFAVHAAGALLRRDGRTPPAIFEMTGYHAEGEAMAVGRFLPHPGAGATITLKPGEAGRRLKQRMLDCHATQRAVLASFPVQPELFRRAPAYDFGAPPHGGPLFYDRQDWGMTGDRWRRFARDAMRTLRLGTAPWR